MNNIYIHLISNRFKVEYFFLKFSNPNTNVIEIIIYGFVLECRRVDDQNTRLTGLTLMSIVKWTGKANRVLKGYNIWAIWFGLTHVLPTCLVIHYHNLHSTSGPFLYTPWHVTNSKKFSFQPNNSLSTIVSRMQTER